MDVYDAHLPYAQDTTDGQPSLDGDAFEPLARPYSPTTKWTRFPEQAANLAGEGQYTQAADTLEEALARADDP